LIELSLKLLKEGRNSNEVELDLSKTQPSSCKKTFPKGGWVCWKAFTAAPLNVLLLSFQTYRRCHLSLRRMLPIKYVKEPLGKGL
jgi:hypothetical protein